MVDYLYLSQKDAAGFIMPIDIQGIRVQIQPLFPGEAILLFGPGDRHLGGVSNARLGPIAFAERNDSYGLWLGSRVRVRIRV